VTNRNILILGALAIVVLIIGYYFLLLGPLLGRLDEQAQAREDKQAQLTQVQQEVNKLEEVRSNSPEIQRQILELSKRIPAQPQIPTLVVQVQEVADASGVTQLTIDPEPPVSPEGGGNYQVVPVTMHFGGTYDEMQDFLLRTRNLTRLVSVTNVTYCRDPPLDTEHTCEIEEVVEIVSVDQTTTLDPTVEVPLEVQIEAEIYFQPTGATSGESTTTVTETTTPEQPAETTSGG